MWLCTNRQAQSDSVNTLCRFSPGGAFDEFELIKPKFAAPPALHDDPSRSLSPPASTAAPSPSPRPRPPTRRPSAPTRFRAPRPASPGRHPRLPLPLAPLPGRRRPRRPWRRRRGLTRPSDRVPLVVPWRLGAWLGLPPALRLLVGHRVRPLLRGRRVPPPRCCRGGLTPPFRH